ncbi:helix-turn-helix domain-containing protein [Comamonas jiangduensis]|uniref:helix-turn-helix domain-containing protein n=1 Tax=Comamonas jiangduensis TaxID=1194168 RepID=UPI0015831B6A|nr:helix-turn-helix transcriptional regulator [Comamonas jiangduensis]
MPLHTPKYTQFLEQLRQLRLQLGVTQVELSKRLGKPQQYVSRCEVGERRLDAVELIEWCEALGADVNVFFSDLQKELRKQKSPALE